MSETFAVSIGANSVSIYTDGEYYSLDSSNANFGKVVEMLRSPDRTPELEREILDLFDVTATVLKASAGRVRIEENRVLFNDEEVGGYMVERLLEIAGSGMDVTSWMLFMDHLMDNPNPGVREDLFRWMENGKMPITPDGCLIAFKKVRTDYKDVHSGKFDNSPGSVLEMPRSQCDENRNNTCSSGFHFCSASYLSSFGGQRVVTVKINPRDVTAIPTDYNLAKGRCCMYVVTGELSSQAAAKHKVWDKPVLDLEDPRELPEVMLPRKGKAGKKAGVKSLAEVKVDPRRTKGAPPKDDLAEPAKKGRVSKSVTPVEEIPCAPPSSAGRKSTAKKGEAMPKKTTTKKAASPKSTAKAPARKATAPKATTKASASKTVSKKAPAKTTTAAATVKKAASKVTGAAKKAAAIVTDGLGVTSPKKAPAKKTTAKTAKAPAKTAKAPAKKPTAPVSKPARSRKK